MEAFFWPFVLLLVGLLLIFLEVFIPSGGILSVLAAAAVVASVAVAFSEGTMAGALMLVGATLLVPVVVAMAIRWWPHTPIGRLILIKRPESEDEVLPDTEEYHLRDRMIGKVGVAKTHLLPSGDVKIDERVYDAVSIGTAIDKGQKVKVVDVNTQRLVVRLLTNAEGAQEETADDVLSTPLDSLGIDPFEDPLA